MKKFYAFFVVVIISAYSLNAQTNYFWVGATGGAGGAWNNAANWAASSGGAGGFGVPNNTTHNAVFDQGALVNVDIASINLNGITVTNSSTATLFTTAVTTITLNSTSSTIGQKALNINSGSTLRDSCDANVVFAISFANGTRGDVNGTWYFSGNGTVTGSNGATFALPLVSGQGNRLDVNGIIHMRSGSVTPGSTVSDEYLFFNSAALFWLDRNGGSTPRSNWNTNATILITGTTSAIPTINVGAVPEIGNLVFNCVLNPSVPPYSLSLQNLLVIKGNLQVLNTNNQMLVLASNGFGATPFNASIAVNGNFDISGNSRVGLARASLNNKTASLQVGGNMNAGGTSFDLQIANTPDVAANAVTLRVRGNINHTAGTFGSSSNATNTTVDLFNIELNGTLLQTISSVTGSFDNANSEVTLRIDNAAGATLNSPLSVGKLGFNTTNGGIINTTTSNALTINNSGTQSLVLNGPGAGRFVNGPVHRKTASNTAYLMPTGSGSTYHACEILPTTAAASEYSAQHFGAAFSDLSVLLPLTGVSNLEYWEISTVSGSDAALLLSLNGTAVPGAVSGDAIAVGRYNGADWAYFSGLGTRIVPGNATAGTTRSNNMTGLGGFFTFAFGPASALPIQLLTFEASKTSSSTAAVKWSLSKDSDPASFEVMRSADGSHFSSIGVLKATDGLFNYSFTDLTLPKGTSYYRLRMTDKEGDITYSRVAVVLNDVKGIFITYMAPTIVQSVARLGVTSSESGNMHLVFTDMHGRMIKRQQATIIAGSQEVILNVQSLPSGTYQVSAYMDNNRVGSIRFLKQ